MRRKYRRGIDMVDKKSRYVNLGLLLLTVAAIVLVPAASATQGYLDALNSVFPSAGNSCGTCHQGGVGGASRIDYGKLFESQVNHASDPTAALKTIGAPGSGVPATPAVVPNVPTTPAVVPDVPAIPAVVPDVPAIPAVVPDVPAIPAVVPGVPTTEEQEHHGHNGRHGHSAISGHVELEETEED